MEKNESMMTAAAYFWLDTFNAFMFGYGPASPTLADVLMLTGLDISTADDGSLFNRKPKHRVDTLAQAFKVKILNLLFVVPIRAYTYIILSGCNNGGVSITQSR
jgi:hypothetical protein